jgi:hypothetical protein
MLYGRLAMILRGAAASAAGSIVSASPATSSRRPGYAAASSARAARQRGSRSIATTRRAPSASSARVRPPGPAPISMTVAWSSGPAARAMLPVRLRSRRKFCPYRRCAAMACRAMTSRSGGSATEAAWKAGSDAGLRRGPSASPPSRPPAAARRSDCRLWRCRVRRSRMRCRGPARSAQTVAPMSR